MRTGVEQASLPLMGGASPRVKIFKARALTCCAGGMPAESGAVIVRRWIGIGALSVLGAVGVASATAPAAQAADTEAIAGASGGAPGSRVRLAAVAAKDRKSVV